MGFLGGASLLFGVLQLLTAPRVSWAVGALIAMGVIFLAVTYYNYTEGQKYQALDQEDGETG